MQVFVILLNYKDTIKCKIMMNFYVLIIKFTQTLLHISKLKQQRLKIYQTNLG